MQRDKERQSEIILSIIGIIPVVWLGLLIAPSVKGGLPEIFPSLMNVFNKSFWENHKTVQFDTLTEKSEYEVVAAFKTVAYTDGPESFKYYHFVNAENEDKFNAYISKCKGLAFYDTGVSATYGDKLITLSTCEYSHKNGRMVVVAKKIAE